MTRHRNAIPPDLNVLLTRIKKCDPKLSLKDFANVLVPLERLGIQRNWSITKQDELSAIQRKLPSAIASLKRLAATSAPFLLATVNAIVNILGEQGSESDIAKTFGNIALRCLKALEIFELTLTLRNLDFERLACNLLTRVVDKACIECATCVCSLLHRRVCRYLNVSFSSGQFLDVPFVANFSESEVCLLVVAHLTAALRLSTLLKTKCVPSKEGQETYLQWLDCLNRFDSELCAKQVRELRKFSRTLTVDSQAEASLALNLAQLTTKALELTGFTADVVADYLALVTRKLVTAANSLLLEEWLSTLLHFTENLNVIAQPGFYASMGLCVNPANSRRVYAAVAKTVTKESTPLLVSFLLLQAAKGFLSLDECSAVIKRNQSYMSKMSLDEWHSVLHAVDELAFYLHKENRTSEKLEALQLACSLLEESLTCIPTAKSLPRQKLQLALCKRLEMAASVHHSLSNVQGVKSTLNCAVAAFPFHLWRENTPLLERLVQKRAKSFLVDSDNPFLTKSERGNGPASPSAYVPAFSLASCAEDDLIAFLFVVERRVLFSSSYNASMKLLFDVIERFRESSHLSLDHLSDALFSLAELYMAGSYAEDVPSNREEALTSLERVRANTGADPGFSCLALLLECSLRESHDTPTVDHAAITRLSKWYVAQDRWEEFSSRLERVFSSVALLHYGCGSLEACRRYLLAHLKARDGMSGLNRDDDKLQNEEARQLVCGDLILCHMGLGKALFEDLPIDGSQLEFSRRCKTWGELYCTLAQALSCVPANLERRLDSLLQQQNSEVGKEALGTLQGFAYLVYSRCLFERGDLTGSFVFADEALLRFGRAKASLLKLLKTVEAAKVEAVTALQGGALHLINVPFRLLNGVLLCYEVLGQVSAVRGTPMESLYFYRQQRSLSEAMRALPFVSDEYAPLRLDIIGQLLHEHNESVCKRAVSAPLTGSHWKAWVYLRRCILEGDQMCADRQWDNSLSLFHSVLELSDRSGPSSKLDSIRAMASLRVGKCLYLMGKVGESERWFASQGDISGCPAPLRGEYLLVSAIVKLAKAAEGLKLHPRLLVGDFWEPEKYRSSVSKRIEQARALLETCRDAVHTYCTPSQLHTQAVLCAKLAFLERSSKDMTEFTRTLSACKSRTLELAQRRQEVNASISNAKICAAKKKHGLSHNSKWPKDHPYNHQVPNSEFSLRSDALNDLLSECVVVDLTYNEMDSVVYVTRLDSYFGIDNPLILQLPLSRRANEEGFSLTSVMSELASILDASYQTTHASDRQGTNLTAEQKQQWWSERLWLDKRLSKLLDRVDRQWFGGFGGVLSQNPLVRDGANLEEFRSGVQGWLQKIFALTRRPYACNGIDDRLLFLLERCNCDDLRYCEDMALYLTGQAGSGESLQKILREHKPSVTMDQPVILVLDRNLHGFPWESLPSLRGTSVTRAFSLPSLLDKWRARSLRSSGDKVGYILNPEGDLVSTQHYFEKKLQKFSGLVATVPQEDQMRQLLESSSVFLYFGHGSGEQYFSGQQIRALGKCSSAVILMGCSSGRLKSGGEFDPMGTLVNYALSPCLATVANLWDVTDRDLDRFSDACLETWGLFAGSTARADLSKSVSLAREHCKLKFLVGAAPVVYGVPLLLDFNAAKPSASFDVTERSSRVVNGYSPAPNLADSLCESFELTLE